MHFLLLQLLVSATLSSPVLHTLARNAARKLPLGSFGCFPASGCHTDPQPLPAESPATYSTKTPALQGLQLASAKSRALQGLELNSAKSRALQGLELNSAKSTAGASGARRHSSGNIWHVQLAPFDWEGKARNVKLAYRRGDPLRTLYAKFALRNRNIVQLPIILGDRQTTVLEWYMRGRVVASDEVVLGTWYTDAQRNEPARKRLNLLLSQLHQDFEHMAATYNETMRAAVLLPTREWGREMPGMVDVVQATVQIYDTDGRLPEGRIN